MPKAAIIRNGLLFGDLNLGRLDEGEASEAVRVRGKEEVIRWWASKNLSTIQKGKMLEELFEKYGSQVNEQPGLF